MKAKSEIIIAGHLDIKGRYESACRVYDSEGISPALNTCSGGGLEPYILVNEMKKLKLRKNTERECFRLMGVNDDEIDLIQSAGIASSRQYELAGNSIVVDVLAAIFRNLLIECEKPQDCLF